MRKVLSFVLVLALVLGSFSMAFGLTDVAGDAKEEAINVCNDLGIIEGFEDGTFKPDQAVNRAQFAAMITRALGIPESALAAYTATGFKDVEGYGWAVKYLAFCESKGIIEGDGMGNVMPGRTISVNEAITMVARAVGYTNNSAVLVGTWPANYVSLGQDLGLYDKLAAAGTVDRANAAQVIFNALAVSKVQVNADGETNAIFPAVNMLTSGLNCTAAPNEFVAYNDSSLINLVPLVGAYGTKYLNSDGEIVTFVSDSTFLTGKINAAGNKFKADGVEYTISGTTAITAPAIVNAGPAAGAASTVAAELTSTTTTYTLAVDLSGKTIKGVYSEATWTPTVDDYAPADVQDDIDEDQQLLGKDFALNDDSEIDLNSFVLQGVTSLADIEEDDVVYVYTYNNGAANDIVKVAVGQEVIEGTVTARNSDGEFKIDGTFYANSGVALTAMAATDVSSDVKVYLDAYGKIYDFDVTSASADTYGVVTAAQTTSGYDKIIKMLAGDAGNKTYSIASDVTYNGNASTASALVVGQLVQFGLDDDGAVDSMKITTGAVANANTSYTTGQVEFLSTKVVSVGATSYPIADDVVVYTWTGATLATATDWGTTTIGNLVGNTITSNASLYFNGDSVVKAIVVNEDDADADADSLYAVVDNSTLTVNADGDRVYQLEGYANGAVLNKLSSNETIGAAVDTKTGTTFIYLYKFTTNGDGDINGGTAGLTLIGAAGNVVAGSATSGTGIVVESAGATFVKVSGAAVTFPIASDAVYYEVEFDAGNVDSYSLFTGTVRAGYTVWLYDTDTDDADYDVVIVLK